MNRILDYTLTFENGDKLEYRSSLAAYDSLPESGKTEELIIGNAYYHVQIIDVKLAHSERKDPDAPRYRFSRDVEYYQVECTHTIPEGMKYRIRARIADGAKVHNVSYDSAEIPAEGSTFYRQVNGTERYLKCNAHYGIPARRDGQIHFDIYAYFIEEGMP
jgi:hypothetical protein